MVIKFTLNIEKNTNIEFVKSPLDKSDYIIILCDNQFKIDDLDLLKLNTIPQEMLNSTKSILFHDNNITDITIICDLFTNLETLSLSNNNISDISQIYKLKYLKDLSISNNNITDIDAISNLVELNILNIHNNKITNINPINNLIKLNQLNVSRNLISNIDVINNLVELNILSINNNLISNVDVIFNLKKLTFMNISFNKIIIDSNFIEKCINVLPELYLEGNIYNTYINITEIKNLDSAEYICIDILPVLYYEYPSHPIIKSYTINELNNVLNKDLIYQILNDVCIINIKLNTELINYNILLKTKNKINNIINKEYPIQLSILFY